VLPAALALVLILLRGRLAQHLARVEPPGPAEPSQRPIIPPVRPTAAVDKPQEAP